MREGRYRLQQHQPVCFIGVAPGGSRGAMAPPLFSPQRRRGQALLLLIMTARARLQAHISHVCTTLALVSFPDPTTHGSGHETMLARPRQWTASTFSAALRIYTHSVVAFSGFRVMAARCSSADRETIDNKSHQPRAFFFPKREFGVTTVVRRSFQPSWFDKWPWLHYCEDSDSVFCFTCMKA